MRAESAFAFNLAGSVVTFQASRGRQLHATDQVLSKNGREACTLPFKLDRCQLRSLREPTDGDALIFHFFLRREAMFPASRRAVEFH